MTVSEILGGGLLLVLLAGILVWQRKRACFAYRPEVGRYFIESGCLVWNYRIPQQFPLERIAWAEFSVREAEMKVDLVLKDGRTYSFQFRDEPVSALEAWIEDFQRAGIRCLRA